MTAEMKHSRAELRRHLKQGVDVTVLRKRVSWLERRIEKVLRMQSQQVSGAGTRGQWVVVYVELGEIDTGNRDKKTYVM